MPAAAVAGKGDPAQNGPYVTPWGQVADDPFFDDSPIPGMISPEERKMLYWAARDHWMGVGEIVEIGSFAGLSTSYLAEGIKHNTRSPYKTSRLHVFDLFQIEDGNIGRIYLQFLPQLAPDYRGSFQHLFERNTRPWREFIVMHPGDTYEKSWSGKPIEILFIDCSITEHFHGMLFQKFYPSLVPSQALLIHQDFFYHRSYYLAPMMKKLAAYFEPVANADTSVVYRYTRPLDGELFRRPFFAGTADLLDTLQATISDFGGLSSAPGGVLGTSMVFYYMSHGQRQLAQELAANIDRQNQHEVVQRNLRDALAA